MWLQGMLGLGEHRRQQEKECAQATVKMLFQHFPGVLLGVDHQGLIRCTNPQAMSCLALSDQLLLEKSPEVIAAQGEASVFARAIRDCISQGSAWQGLVTCRTGGGGMCQMSVVVQPFYDAGLACLVMLHDISEVFSQVLAERYLHENNETPENISTREDIESYVARIPGIVFRLRQAHEGALSFDYLGPGFEEQTLLCADEVRKDADVLLNRMSEEQRLKLFIELAQSGSTMSPWRLEMCIDSGSSLCWFEARGVPQRVADGAVAWDGLLLDITERKLHESQIEKLVSTDALTGVMNRRAFHDAAEAAAAQAMRHGQHVVLAMLDLDHFKALNDCYGHAAGDKVLQSFSETCRMSLRPYDLIARIGGEEFVVMLVDVQLVDAREILERLRSNVESMTMQVGDRALRVTVSMGAIWLDEAEELEMAMLRVDRALYEAKHAGRNCLRGLSRGGWLDQDEISASGHEGDGSHIREYRFVDTFSGSARLAIDEPSNSLHELPEGPCLPTPCPNCGQRQLRAPTTGTPDAWVYCGACRAFVCRYNEAADFPS